MEVSSMALGSNSLLKEVKMICMQISSLYSLSNFSIWRCNFTQGAQCGLEIMVIHSLASLLPNNIPVFLSMSYWGCSFNKLLNTEAFSFMLLSLLLLRWICFSYTYNVTVKWSDRMTSPYTHPMVVKSNKSHWLKSMPIANREIRKVIHTVACTDKHKAHHCFTLNFWYHTLHAV